MAFPKLVVILALVSAGQGKHSHYPNYQLSKESANESVYSEEMVHFIDPEVTPSLFEGDIAGMTSQMLLRLGLNWQIFPERKWTNGTIPYHISSDYHPDERQVIQTAISILNFFTCVKFVPWDRYQQDYLHILPAAAPKGCWSHVGKIGGEQPLSLQPPNKKSLQCLGSIGKPIHEILHALGIFHEQTRPDREKHVIVLTDNIAPGNLHNFKTQSSLDTTYPYPYDYNSVMHYGSYFFSKPRRRRPTIVPVKKGVHIGQRVMLSKLDCLKINHLYECFQNKTFESDKYRAFCEILAY